MLSLVLFHTDPMFDSIFIIYKAGAGSESEAIRLK